jgi:TolB-like protein/Flp pilus assembly protein TadD
MAGDGLALVGVLPIVNRGGNELDIIAEDLTDDITRELAQNFHFKVMPAGNRAPRRGSAMEYRALGRELGANYLVESKLQRTGDNIRLTMQVIDSATGGMLRSSRFEKKIAEIELAPEDFAAAVAAQFGDEIVQCETHRAMTTRGPVSGWDHVLRAHAHGQRVGSDGTHRALEELREAVRVAPDLGMAHALLAAYLGVAARLGIEKLDDLRQEIHAHIKQALRLDGENPGVLTSLALTHGLLEDAEASLRLARRAVELTPNSPYAQAALGRAYLNLGRISEATTAFRTQDRLASNSVRFSSHAWLAACLCLEGEPVEAEAILDRALAINPDFATAFLWKAVALAQQGREKDARSTIVRLREAEAQMSLDQHLHAIFQSQPIRELSDAVISILHRLWDAVESEGKSS